MNPSPENPSPARIWWLLPLLVAAGLWRFWLASQTFVPDFDTGTVALMVQHILDGQRPLYFYGQNYMGAFEAYAAAGCCRLFGYSALALAASPILMSLGWIAGVVVLLRACSVQRGLLLAGLLLAFPGWMTERYMISTYGGYPAVLMFGTWSLWAAVRSTRSQGHGKIGWLVCWGLLAAFGLWTHFLVAPFLISGGLVMLWHHRQRPLAFAPLLFLGCLLALHGLLPRLLTQDVFVSNLTTELSVEPAHFAKSLKVLWHDNLPLLLFRGHLNSVGSMAWHAYLQIAFLCIVVAAAFRVRKASPRFAAVTGLFILSYLALYLPHSMSTLRAPRYLIPLMGMLLPLTAAGWCAFNQPLLRWFGCTLLGLWVLHQAHTVIHYKGLEAPRATGEIQVRDRLIRDARAAGVTHSGILGGIELRHRGQALTAHAKGSPIFTNVRDERYLPFTRAFLQAGHYGYTVDKVNAPRVYKTLEALKVSWQNTDNNRLVTYYDLVPNHLYPAVQLQRVMPPDIEGPAALNDQTLHTHETAGTITLQFKRPIALGMIWMMNAGELQETLPDHYLIEGQRGNGTWTRLAKTRIRMLHGEVIGSRVFIDSYYGRTEHRFNGEKIRGLRIHVPAPHPHHAIGECWVFEQAAPRGAAPAEQPRMRSWFADQGVSTVWADLWVSAQLQQHSELEILPPYNPKFKETNRPRDFIPSADLGLVVEHSLEKTVEGLIDQATEKNLIRMKQRFGPYTGYTFVDQEPPEPLSFYWDGRVLMNR